LRTSPWPIAAGTRHPCIRFGARMAVFPSLLSKGFTKH